MPTTPLQVSPQDLPVGELVGEVGQSSGGTHVEGEGGDNTVIIPGIMVTVAEEDSNCEMPPPELLGETCFCLYADSENPCHFLSNANED